MTLDSPLHAGSADDRSDDLRSVADSLRVLFQAIRLHNVHVERTLGMSLAQLYVLERIAEQEGCSVNDLAEITRTHQSSVSVVVRKLVERGLIVRGICAEDARRAKLSLSDHGRELLLGAPSSLQSRLGAGLRRLGEQRTRVLAQSLSEWITLCGLHDDAPPMLGEDEPRSHLMVEPTPAPAVATVT